MRFYVTMGQSFQRLLPRYLEEIGGKVEAVEWPHEQTKVKVLVYFPPRTKQRDIAQLLLSHWQMAWSIVERATLKEEK